MLIEWPLGEAEPTKYWPSTPPSDIGFRELVDFAKLRWRIGRDYLELKQEVGLGHFEGRGWRGFHHHATICIAVYGSILARMARSGPASALSEFRRSRMIPSSWPIECAFARLMDLRGVATRYDKLANNFPAGVLIAANTKT